MPSREIFDSQFPVVRALLDLAKHCKDDNHFVTISAEQQERWQLPIICHEIKAAMIDNESIKDVIILVEFTEAPRFQELLTEHFENFSHELGLYIQGEHEIVLSAHDSDTYSKLKEKHPFKRRSPAKE